MASRLLLQRDPATLSSRGSLSMTHMVQASLEQVEQDFWDIVEGGDESVQVLYGADLDTRGGRSGFPVRKQLRSKSGQPGPGCDPHVLGPAMLWTCSKSRSMRHISVGLHTWILAASASPWTAQPRGSDPWVHRACHWL